MTYKENMTNEQIIKIALDWMEENDKNNDDFLTLEECLFASCKGITKEKVDEILSEQEVTDADVLDYFYSL